MFTVTKEFSFEAAHSLPHLPKGHKCRNLHGHSYKVVVHCSGELDDRGFVVDYQEISNAMYPLIKHLDHQNLNEILDFKTTAENIARYIYEKLKQNKVIAQYLVAIEVRETEKTSVIYRP